MQTKSTFRTHPQETSGTGHGNMGGTLGTSASRQVKYLEECLVTRGHSTLFAVTVMMMMVTITTTGLRRTERKTNYPRIMWQ